MDLVASCKEKLSYFRIKELKDVLTQLGLSKQGKKQDLVDRILAIISDDQVSRMWAKKNTVRKEEVAKLVEDTYRKMQVSGATELASLGQGVSDSGSLKLKEEIDDPYQSDSKVRCLCGSLSRTESMIKCDDPKCHVWQHLGCVIIPDKPADGVLPPPQIFFCEICRLSRADPFWLTVAHPLYPVKLNITVPTEGANPVKTFQLTRADKDLLSRQDYDVQAWCMLLNDKVPYRMQWPQYADLQVNGVPVRAINRPGSQLLGANGRDDGPIITPCTKDGINKICLTGCDARVFCLGVRLVKRRSLQQIMNMIPKESEGETFEYALARVRRCVGGGSSKDNADSDSDLEVVAESITFNLRCPMSGSRIKVAGRFKPCLHMGCFDLHVFVEMNQRSRKWQCPTCLKNYSLESIIIDPYFNHITSMMQLCGDDVTDIEVKPDGSWRVKAKSENERRDLGDLGVWHLPDGSLILPSQNEVKVKMEIENVKQEGVSEGHTNLKLRKNPNGHWEVRKPKNMPNHLSSGNKQEFVNGEPKIIPMSSRSTGSGRDEDDRSVNQDGGGWNYDFSMNNVMEYDSTTLNEGVEAYACHDQNVSTQEKAEVIVLSDSEEDEPLVSLGPAGKNMAAVSGVNFCVPHHGIPDPFPNDPTLGAIGGSCFGLFNNNSDEYEMTMWQLPPSNQAGTSFQLFGSDAGATSSLDDLQQGSMTCTSSINGYSLVPDAGLGSSTLLSGSSVHHADANNGLVDNPMAFSGADPSLQIFLPTKPSETLVQSDVRDQDHVSNGMRADDWISLRLGGSPNGSHGGPASVTALASRDQLPFTESGVGSSQNSAPLHMNMNGDRPDRTSRPRSESDSPFSFPRQKRSVRAWQYLSTDSGSE